MHEVMRSWTMVYRGGGGRMVGNSDFKKIVSIRLGDMGEENSKMAHRFQK